MNGRRGSDAPTKFRSAAYKIGPIFWSESVWAAKTRSRGGVGADWRSSLADEKELFCLSLSLSQM
jgi:hypothetical protein